MSMDELEALKQRLAAVEADIEIRNLIARYAMVMDDRDVDSIPALFTKDARVTSGEQDELAALTLACSTILASDAAVMSR